MAVSVPDEGYGCPVGAAKECFELHTSQATHHSCAPRLDWSKVTMER